MHHIQTGSATGATIVFLHGANFDGRMWGEITALLPDFRCIAVDLPGHGGSRDTPFISFDAAGDEVAAFIRSVVAGEAAIVGISLGAYVGFRLLVRHPDLVPRAILSGFQSGPIPMGPFMQGAMAASSWLMGFRGFRERMARSLGAEDVSLISDAAGRPNASAATTWRVGRLAVAFDAVPDLQNVRARTLVLAGEKEHPTIRGSLPAFERGLPDAAVRIAPGVGHGWSAQDPRLFALTVGAWMTDQALPDTLKLCIPSCGVQRA